MEPNEIRKWLLSQEDKTYGEFQRKLIPGIDPETIIGVRTPVLRKYAKELSQSKQAFEFLKQLPHVYFEENQLHAFLLSADQDYEHCIAGVEAFLPYVDNWATCDQMSPKIFKKHLPELLGSIKKWIASDRTYTIRFGIGMLMQHYLDDAFLPDYLEMVAGIRSEEYYVNMMIAWYFATALAKQYEAVIGYIENGILDKWVHNKTIQKAVESFRITDAQKIYLKSLKK